MKPKSKMLVAVVLGLAFASIGCQKGACVYNLTTLASQRTCVDDDTPGGCSIVSGTFSKDMTCEDLGFRTTNDRNMGITGIS